MTSKIIASSIFALCASMASADSWSLDAEASHLAFGSVKNDYTGEVHSFGALSGTVSADGMVAIEIGLGTVQTNIDIRNERMGEHVFAGTPTAGITAQIDMAAMTAMAVGETKVMEVEADLSLLDEEIFVPTFVFIARMSEDRVLISTNDFIYVATDELGIDAGIDTLQELAGLDNIARSVPISARLVFDLDS